MEAVLFDIGGVLLDLRSVRRGYEAFLDAIAEQEGVADPDAFVDDWRAALGAYFGERDGTEYRLARVGYEQALEAALGYHLPREAWWETFRETTLQHVAPHEGAVETVERLADHDYHLGVVSDIDTGEAEDILGSFGILRHFDAVTTSEAVGRTKPDPAMFETALSRAGSDPARTLYVGDRYEHDMVGGSRAGLVTVAHGGSAAERAAEDPEDAVDHVVADLRELLDLVD